MLDNKLQVSILELASQTSQHNVPLSGLSMHSSEGTLSSHTRERGLQRTQPERAARLRRRSARICRRTCNASGTCPPFGQRGPVIVQRVRECRTKNITNRCNLDAYPKYKHEDNFTVIGNRLCLRNRCPEQCVRHLYVLLRVLPLRR